MNIGALPLFAQDATEPRFNGPSYEPARDETRLMNQLERVKAFTLGHASWYTVAEIAAGTGDPETSVSAQLRHLRKAKHGGFVVQKRLRGESKGLYEYHVSAPLVGEAKAS